MHIFIQPGYGAKPIDQIIAGGQRIHVRLIVRNAFVQKALILFDVAGMENKVQLRYPAFKYGRAKIAQYTGKFE